MQPVGNILIVEDDPDILVSLNLFIKHEFESVTTTNNPNDIPGILSSKDINVIILDMNFKPGARRGEEGIAWLKKILEIDSDAVVIMLTAYGDINLAVNAIKLGATDFITKPWDNDKLITTLKTGVKLKYSRKELNSLKQKQKQILQDIDRDYEILWGRSQVMNELRTAVAKVAQTDTSVLIVGENGTGKDLVAHEIHRLSHRADEVFIKVDIGALNENVFENEMFGHAKGAFTDAKEEKAGRFEIADKGTLFIDEIGNLSLYLQSKLLTAIQNQEINRVGSNKTVQFNIRLISATNKDIQQLVKENLFRQDLLYRIETIRIVVPPLRERGEDILQLSDYFLERYGLKYGKPLLKLNSDAQRKLLNYYWPGNVRELQHAIEKAVIMTDQSILKPNDFHFLAQNDSPITPNNSLNLSDLERQVIELALNKHRFNLSETAKELGITRPTLYKKMEKYKIKP
jgi:DNA-binding NtrC family response regulator